MSTLVPTKVKTTTFRRSCAQACTVTDPVWGRLWVAVRDRAGHVWGTYTAAGLPNWVPAFSIGAMRDVISHCLLETQIGAVLLTLNKAGKLVAVRLAEPHDPFHLPDPGVEAVSIHGTSYRGTSGDALLVIQGRKSLTDELYLTKLMANFASWPPASGSKWDLLGSGFSGAPALVVGEDDVWIFAPGKDYLFYMVSKGNWFWWTNWSHLKAPDICSCHAGFVQMVPVKDRYISVTANCCDGKATSVMPWYQESPTGGLYPVLGTNEASYITSIVNYGTMLIGNRLESGGASIYTFFVKEAGPWRLAFTSRTYPEDPNAILAWCPKDILNPYGAGYLQLICADTSAYLGTQIATIGKST